MAEQDPVYDNITSGQLAEAVEQIQQQLAEGRTRLTTQRAQCQALLREIKLARAAASDRSWELADVEQRLRDLNEQREGPGDLLMEREIAHLTGRRTKLEEDVLAHLLLVDDMIARAQAAEQALAAAAQDWAAYEATLIAEHDYIAQLIVTARHGSTA